MSDVLIYASTERAPELRHEVPAAIVDPFLYAERNGDRYAVVSQLDADEARAAAPDLQVLAPEELGLDELIAGGLDAYSARLELVVRACRRLGIERASVPPAFPVELADRLRAEGIELAPDRRLFAGRRRRKSRAELEGIRRAQRAAEAGMAAAAELLRRGEPVSSEEIKAAVEAGVAREGAHAGDMIVSHGPQSAIGHERGSGRIAPGEPVIVDVWPADRASGCHADMTRTFVIGEPDPDLRAWHALCREALERAVGAIRPGVTGRELYELVSALFHEHGHPTQLSKKPGEVLRDGFYHGLGHGVGLETHEPPTLGRGGADELVEGDVLAVEPGLYRHGYGGCRIEDLVLVTAEGCEVLTRFPYELEP